MCISTNPFVIFDTNVFVSVKHIHLEEAIWQPVMKKILFGGSWKIIGQIAN